MDLEFHDLFLYSYLSDMTFSWARVDHINIGK
jgi:hypothetical protein